MILLLLQQIFEQSGAVEKDSIMRVPPKRGMGMWITRTLVTLLLFGLIGVPNNSAQSAEGASGTYLLGSKGSMAGFLPPPGVYLQDTNYFYSGQTNGTLDLAGLIVAGGVDADAFYNIPTLLWVLPQKIFGGNLALSVTTPIGWKDVSADLSLTGPGGTTISANLADDDLALGDPVLGATLGWHEGNFHWNLGALYNAPAGFWQRGNLSNIGFNRSSIDTTAAITWLDPKIGLEMSTAAGFTFNFENPSTDYRTGTEFHIEWALIQNLSKSFGLGLVGYHYQQITGDSGAGASLGDFKGRVTALGPAINYNFALGQLPVSTSFKYLKEFDVENRLEGDVGMLTLTMPLEVFSPPLDPMK